MFLKWCPLDNKKCVLVAKGRVSIFSNFQSEQNNGVDS